MQAGQLPIFCQKNLEFQFLMKLVPNIIIYVTINNCFVLLEKMSKNVLQKWEIHKKGHLETKSSVQTLRNSPSPVC